ncbi:sigma-54-dependent Fis family transcriptional regulator [Candidatus Pacearchaeota archaeon]|nr:sigma-54-dependent Fis family transcriptional regulator [Candidatus Pacearchaeota archaeon]
MTVEFIGGSDKIVSLREKLTRIAEWNDNILLIGESGVGKEVAANYILQNGERKDSPYLPFNCGAVSRALLEDTLFGHEKGAFTGAYDKKEGLLEVVNGGTLFLDEIGEMIKKEGGADLLRVIEYGDFMRVGGNKLLHSDVRIIAADSNLEDISSELFYRFPDVVVVPSLRDRAEDIPLLTDYFLKELNKKTGRDLSIPNKIIDEFVKYSWPGNVRQLKNTVNRFCKHGEIEYHERVHNKGRVEADASNDILYAKAKEKGIDFVMEDVEKSLIFEAMREGKGKRISAANLLKTSYRSFRYTHDKYFSDK